jgi:hypothetical protein
MNVYQRPRDDPATPPRRKPRRGPGTLEPLGQPRQSGAVCLRQNIYEVAGKADTDPMFPDDP